MITVTDSAKAALKEILLNKVDNSYALLRLTSPGKGQLGLGIDVELPEDNALEYENAKLLLVDSKLADTLQGVTLDIDQTPQGLELVIIGG